ncbi:Ribosomal RNA processing protein 36 [Spironucleus salmonicida]|nr:Ribosomal RNA processing protein 36 [Spironucleus salmonicida]
MKFSANRPISLQPKEKIITQTKHHDPRFSGEKLDKSKIYENYSFISEIRQKEYTVLAQQSKSKNASDDLKNAFNRTKQKLGQYKAHQVQIDFKNQLKEKEQEAVVNGKQRYFMNKRDERKITQAVSFNQQMKKGKGMRKLERKMEAVDKK